MRYRVEIYDEVKSNDLTLFSSNGIDKEHLTELVYSNVNRFQGNVKAFVFDNKIKKKITAVFLPMEIVSRIKYSRPV